eukprot:TRINITY_DN4865_c0_g1_i1.p1 TRINITY_DN4865_c0_g1~~TRINITY_DN4865_c0_g1_i1.p1  ORF type:complete len:160 (-),score=21.98 TRINITY_DN4865_c0_g1_i1:41-520(-)
MIFSVLLLAFSASFATGNNLSTPSWQNLDCEPYHKYLFSEITAGWQDALDECELYGGWLLSINSLQEQNCLLRYARSVGLSGWYRHDGNDIEVEGVWVHGSDNADMSWIHHYWNCCGDKLCTTGGDTLILGVLDNYDGGAWCDEPETYIAHFICEGIHQ